MAVIYSWRLTYMGKKNPVIVPRPVLSTGSTPWWGNHVYDHNSRIMSSSVDKLKWKMIEK